MSGAHEMLPPPLRGWVGVGGKCSRWRLLFTPLPALRADLPLKGGGNKKEFAGLCRSFR
jgi:hypothetical protein